MRPTKHTIRAHRTRVTATTAGAVLLPAALACLAAALIYGGPAVLLSAAACSLLAVSLLTSWLHLRGLEFEPPRSIERPVGIGFTLQLRVRSRARILSACAVRLHSAMMPGKHTTLPYLAAGASTIVEVPYRFQRRGLHRSVAMHLSSAFPFGLVRCERAFTLPAEFLALPRPADQEDARRLTSFEREGVRALAARRVGEDQLWGPRDWREGESLRRVHWKLSARRARRVVSEFRQPEDGPLHLLLITRIADPHARTGARSFERAVSVTAALCERALRNRREIVLRFSDAQPAPENALHGRVGRTLALRALARVQAGNGSPSAIAIKEARLAVTNGQSLVCVFAGGIGGSARPLPRNPRVQYFDVDAIQRVARGLS